MNNLGNGHPVLLEWDEALNLRAWLYQLSGFLAAQERESWSRRVAELGNQLSEKMDLELLQFASDE